MRDEDVTWDIVYSDKFREVLAGLPLQEHGRLTHVLHEWLRQVRASGQINGIRHTRDIFFRIDPTKNARGGMLLARVERRSIFWSVLNSKRKEYLKVLDYEVLR